MSEKEFFEQLLLKTKQQFEMSPIYKWQLKEGKQWHYSVCATPILKRKGIILGINWGVMVDNHEPQKEMPTGDDIEGYHFIRRSKSYLEKYLDADFDSINFNYTNLCFFRTPLESHLCGSDYQLSLPLFSEFVDYINPPWILSLSIGNASRLQSMGILVMNKEYKDISGKHRGVEAQYSGYNFFAVPHPNARVPKKAREEIWQQLFRP